MQYIKNLKDFNELYSMFIYSEDAHFFLECVKGMHLEDLYMEWFTKYFKGRITSIKHMEYVITHKWDDFRMQIPYLTLSCSSSLMHELLDDMDYLASTNDLVFPMVVTWKERPTEWARFIKEIFDNNLPIKVATNAKGKACKIYVMKDFREMFVKE